MEDAQEMPLQWHSFKLKLATLLSPPYRLLARMRRVKEFLSRDTKRQSAIVFGQSDWDSAEVYTAAGRSSRPPPTSISRPLVPGPWGFVTSGYAVGLFVMAILLNRIQNIVVPPRYLFTYRLARTPRTGASLIRSIYYYILPLDFSSTPPRLVFRIPSLYFLCRVLLIWTVTLLQAADLYPSQEPTNLGNWVARKEMEEICWSTFCAVCGALCIGALTRGLDGTSGTGSASPFNMFGYAFLLHIYSSPLTHDRKTQGLPSRPDKHVIVTIMLPLLQLTMTHILGVKQQWACQRLIPTAITCILGLVHFHTVLWFTPSSYPLLNYMPCLFESLLALVTLLTITLNALTQFLLEGAVTRPLFGHAATLLPRSDEDFSVVLLRLGAASLEATSVAGLGNEVGGVAVSDTVSQRTLETEYGTVEMNRTGVIYISPMVEGLEGRRKVREGFANEIKYIRTGGRGETDLWIDTSWYRELAKFGIGVAKFGRGVWRIGTAVMTGRQPIRPLSHAATSTASELGDEVSGEDSDGSEPDIYERFLRGDDVTDDDEDYDPQPISQTTSISHTPSTLSDTADSDDDAAGETLGLYAELTSSPSPSTSTPLMLAHMTRPSSSPLTRKRYNRLVSYGSNHSLDGEVLLDDWLEVGRTRSYTVGSLLPARSARKIENAGDESSSQGAGEVTGNMRNCVICTVEAREIICWPCRCLALCDDCRENLASRSSSTKHRCPCCRRSVEGYSRIFIP